MIEKLASVSELTQKNTSELKNYLLAITKGKDTESLNRKTLFYKNELSPIFEELSRRNPFPKAEEQASIILGVWAPVWSTIPFQDIVPGRIGEQSYQIFHDNGYYANIARYAPGHQLSFLQNISAKFLAYDLMIIQRYEVQTGQWYIQNVAIEQALRKRDIPLDIDASEDWFTATVKSKSKVFSEKNNFSEAPDLHNLDKSTAKKFTKAFLSIPQLEHLYIDSDFRLVKTQREAKQRPSYTIAVRIR